MVLFLASMKNYMGSNKYSIVYKVEKVVQVR